MTIFGQHAVVVNRNHTDLVNTLIKYHNDGGYVSDLNRVAKEALNYLDQIKIDHEKPAAVFDIDETCLSNNWPQLVDPAQKYNAEAWAKWMQEARDKPIESTQSVFKKILDLNINIFLITGREECFRKATETNLKNAGYAGYKQLIMEPSPTPYLSAASYKSNIRKGLSEDGYKIIFNMGDQESDLKGGFAEKTFKLPNPFYTIC